MILVLGHATRKNGNIYEAPVNTLIELFDNELICYQYLRHYFQNDLDSELVKGSEKLKIRIPRTNSMVRYVFQIYNNIKFIKNIKPNYIIATNPLNALSCMISNFFNVGRTPYIFYSADYSDSRFGNKILDAIYKNIDKMVSFNADYTLSVSSRIVELRKKYGLKDGKNIYIPNVPSTEVSRLQKRMEEEIKLITLGVLDFQFEYENLFSSIKELAKTKKINLTLVGSGPAEEKLKDKVKEMNIENNVIFYGFAEHKSALELISSSTIGLALYNGKWSFNYYGDSMKCREYFNFGLPVITTDTHSTVEDIKKHKCGIIVDNSSESITNAITEIVKNYEFYSKNSIKLGEEFSGIHKKIILPIVKKYEK